MIDFEIRRKLLSEVALERESQASHDSWWPTKETKERVEQNMKVQNLLEMLNG